MLDPWIYVITLQTDEGQRRVILNGQSQVGGSGFDFTDGSLDAPTLAGKRMTLVVRRVSWGPFRLRRIDAVVKCTRVEPAKP